MSAKMMGVSNSYLLLVLSAIFVFQLVPVKCQNASYCEGAQSCGDCLMRDPICAWCPQQGFSDNGASRCNTFSNLTDAGCLNITNPQGFFTIIEEEPLGDADSSPLNKTVQVSPQIIKLTLRQGEPLSVTLNVRPAKDYPLDLYFVMDLSYSMADDLLNLRNLGGVLARELQRLSSDVTMGFGSFVDKLTLPFVFSNQELLNINCQLCDRGFGFRNNLPLSTDLNQFSEKIKVATYSSSNTGPEGGLDGMMQIAVCKDEIGWRDGARHFLVYSSDNGFHIAGDAALAQIFSPNDGRCHLDPVTNEYAKSTEQDFPSIGHLNEKIGDGNIYPIFAVVNKVEQVYSALSKHIKGSTVGVLASDSNNVVNIIKSQYQAITSRIELIDNAPEGISVFYTAHCSEGDTQLGVKECTGLSLGDLVSFDLEITSTRCTNGDTESFTVKPVGFEETLTITLEVLCSCDCEKELIPNSDLCNDGNGALVCGQCECNSGRYGEFCQCSGDIGSGDDTSSCIAPDSKTICSGRGECVCGTCQCFSRQDTNEVITGPFCECDNFSCDRFDGELCGGQERGTCICDEKTHKSRCKCNKGFTGSACQCPDSNDACMARTGLLCNGFGDCVCGECQCDPDESFRGSTCEECGICVGDCGIYRECVLCKVFKQGRLTAEECDQCAVTIATVEQIVVYNETVCETLLPDNCTVKYAYYTWSNGTVLVYVQSKPECPRRGGVGVNLVHVAIGIIVAVLVIGLLIVLLLRLYIWYLDKKEWAEFEKEKKRAKWDVQTNPIYRPSTTKHANPMYGKTVPMLLDKPDKKE